MFPRRSPDGRLLIGRHGIDDAGEYDLFSSLCVPVAVQMAGLGDGDFHRCHDRLKKTCGVPAQSLGHCLRADRLFRINLPDASYKSKSLEESGIPACADNHEWLPPYRSRHV